MSFEKILQEDARLVLLIFLAEKTDWSANEYVLRRGLSYKSHAMSKDRFRTELAWLYEQGLIKLKTDEEGVQFATILNRGLDVARGDAVVPGVTRPSPEDE